MLNKFLFTIAFSAFSCLTVFPATATDNQTLANKLQPGDVRSPMRKTCEANLPTAVKNLIKTAEDGDPEAQYYLARLYARDYQVAERDWLDGILELDWNHAQKWYEKAAVQGHINAQYQLGSMYKSGSIVQKDLTAAAHWLQKAADQGDASAQYDLAEMYRNGEGVTKNLSHAFTLMLKAAKRGHVSAMFTLAKMYYEGRGVEQNFATALYWFQESSRASDPYGKITMPREITNSVEIASLIKTAEDGDARAQYKLANLYATGEIFEPQIKSLMKEAQEGNTTAQQQLAKIYAEEDFLYHNWYMARQWYRKAANQGHTEAKNAFEDTLPRRLKLAIKEAEEGKAPAQYILGKEYFYDDYFTLNETIGTYWLQRAADQGFVLAQCRIGPVCKNKVDICAIYDHLL